MVQACEGENKMGIKNITIVFVPSMYCNPKLFALLVANYGEIFTPKCSKCERMMNVNDNPIVFEKEPNKLICQPCANPVKKVEVPKISGIVEATPPADSPKRMGLIRSISQKWKDRKEFKKTENQKKLETVGSKSLLSPRFKGASNGDTMEHQRSNSTHDVPPKWELSPKKGGDQPKMFIGRKNTLVEVPIYSRKRLSSEMGSAKEQIRKLETLETSAKGTNGEVKMEVDTRPSEHKNGSLGADNGVEPPVFGTSLSVACKQSHNSVMLPTFFRKCLVYIEKNGLFS